MKKLTHSKLSGAIYYGTVNEKKGGYTKKEEIDEEDFKIAMINFVRFREEDSKEGVILNVRDRKFKVVIEAI